MRSIGLRLVVIAAFPLLLMLGFAGYLSKQTWLAANLMDRSVVASGVVKSTAAVMTALAAERGLTNGFMQARTPENQNRVAAQRKVADEALATLAQGLAAARIGERSDTLARAERALVDATATVGGLRRHADGQSAPPATVFAGYTAAIDAGQRFAEVVEAAMDADGVMPLMRSHNLVMDIKERLGRERGTGNGLFASGMMTDAGYRTVAVLHAQAQEAVIRLALHAPAEVAQRAGKAVNADDFPLVRMLRDDLRTTMPGQRLDAPEKAAWFAETTKAIAEIGAVEAQIAALLAERLRAKSEASWNQVLIAIGVALGAVAISVTMVGWNTRSLVGGVSALMRGLDRIGAGECPDLSRVARRPDEIGRLAVGIGDSWRQRHEMDAIRAEQQAQTQQVAVERSRTMLALGETFQSNVSTRVDQVVRAVDAMRSSIVTLAVEAERARSDIGAVENLARGSNDGVHIITDAAEEMSRSVSELSSSAEASAHHAQQVEQAVNEARARFAELREAMGAVQDITSVINSIANQTNLLALNATIEAARAGEAGRAFAIVAGEVKQLSVQTAQATRHIGAEIERIVQVSASAVTQVESAMPSIDQLSQGAIRMAGAMAEQTASIEQISQSARVALETAHELNQRAVAIARSGAEIAQATRQLAVGADELAESGGTLGRDAEGFLRGLAAA